MTRNISREFFNELKEGKFHPVLQTVLEDDTLDLELRGNSVIIYYRGGKMFELFKDGKLTSLDKGWLCAKFCVIEPSLDNLYSYIPLAKQHIDYYLHKKEGKEQNEKQGKSCIEKEIQQLIVRENNYSPAQEHTDFYIIDTEYVASESDARFDIVALQWNSNATEHKLKTMSLVIIEVKYGSGAIKTDKNPGILKHYRDYKNFVDSHHMKEFREEMRKVFWQKVKLGLITIPKNKNWMPDNKEGLKFSDEIKFCVILANNPPKHSALSKELDEMEIEGADMTKCYFFTSSFCGYGLYYKFMKTAKEIKAIADSNKQRK